MTDATTRAALVAAAEKATQGEWWSDSEKSCGCYGSGEDVREGFNAYAVYSDKGSICDTHNSGVAEVHEEYDEDGGHAWDEVGRRNMEYIVAAQPRNILSLLASSDRALAELREENEKLRGENANLKVSVIAFGGPHAARWAKESGLPDRHLHHVHYDALKNAGARMDDFIRHEAALKGSPE